MVKKRKIFLFPGCFDPFHLQHQKIIDFLFENFVFDQLWILINQSSQEKKIIASFEDRFNIIKTNLDNSKNKEKIIIYPKAIGFYTTTLIRELKTKNDDDSFYLVLGEDQINNLLKWEQLENLFQLVHLIAVPREGYPKNDCFIKKFNIQYLQNIESNNFNSSEIKIGYSWKNLSSKTRNYLWEKKIYNQNILKHHLSFQRLQHSKNAAILTQKIWKNASLKIKEKIYQATLFHDLTKEWSTKEHLQFLKKHKINLDILKNEHEAIWHGISGSIFLQKEMLIEDQEILFAIKNHSSSHDKFKTFDKVLFICDKLEKGKKNDPFFKKEQLYLQKNNIDIDYLFSLTLKSVYQKIKSKNYQINETMKKSLKKFVKDL